ncbi:response regulator [Paenibacillus whitsoniae]|uniref:Response regulator n=1 Tax=Paenibacillus whitsoniae TaxID=2496558 RepID=A0A430JI84_9BACL|nr:response regulator [Paenibacillus whitsoniae]RTE10733.1 response regulator [Paenibacillus whitsoniae]
MYKLLIADDDEWIREGMRRSIPWEEGGIRVVGAAKDGQEAWDLIQQAKPDILLSDIRMPFMDGLQLAGLVKAHGLDTKVVFLTGYDDFSYAKQAIGLQAFDYILKYEDNAKVLKAVRQACDKLEEERAVVEKDRKGHGLMVNKFYSDLISGAGNEATVERDSKLLDISFCGSLFGAAAIRMDGVERFLKPNKSEDLELLLFSIKNVCTEVLALQVNGECQAQVVHYNHRINLLFNLGLTDAERFRVEAKRISLAVLSAIEQFLKIKVQIGIGSPGEGIKHIPFSYEEALIASQMKGMANEQGIIFYEQVKHSNNSHQAILKKVTDYIAAHFHNENLDLKEVAETVHITPSYVSTLFKKYNDINFSEYVIRVRMDKAMELLVHTDLKAYEIAESIGYPNTQYFSALFKKYTGLTPMEYRQQHRK